MFGKILTLFIVLVLVASPLMAQTNQLAHAPVVCEVETAYCAEAYASVVESIQTAPVIIEIESFWTGNFWGDMFFLCYLIMCHM